MDDSPFVIVAIAKVITLILRILDYCVKSFVQPIIIVNLERLRNLVKNNNWTERKDFNYGLLKLVILNIIIHI